MTDCSQFSNRWRWLSNTLSPVSRAMLCPLMLLCALGPRRTGLIQRSCQHAMLAPQSCARCYSLLQPDPQPVTVCAAPHLQLVNFGYMLIPKVIVSGGLELQQCSCSSKWPWTTFRSGNRWVSRAATIPRKSGRCSNGAASKRYRSSLQAEPM